MTEELFKKFMRESNAIEDEVEDEFDKKSCSVNKKLFRLPGQLNPGDMEAIKYSLKIGVEDSKAGRVLPEEDVLCLHRILGDYLKKDWVGKWRKVSVYVGGYTPPEPIKIAQLMKWYVDNFYRFDSWTAYNEFEKIHPFQDLNGRVGRLLWLSKAVDEGYRFQLSFEQTYHYQTLSHYENHDL